MPTLRLLLKFLKRHAFAAVCCMLVVAIGITYFMRMDYLDAERVNIEQLQKEAENIKRNLRNAAGLRENLTDLKVLHSIVDARLVRPEDLASNLQYFYRIESETGVKILLLRQLTGTGPVAAAPAGGALAYRPISYSVIVEGSFPQVMAFLTRLERGPHFNRTKVFTAQRGAPDSAEGIRSGTVVVNLSVELMGTP
ncbi:MAG TPA: hypothetical protein VMM36_04295 [Opitutaceae bacterium]|nr:hypothetical protein [Opitutaceae bacterium]